MIADVEAIDEYFQRRFTQGNEQEFLRRCSISQRKTQKLLNTYKQSNNLNGDLVSSSFFDEFGRSTFVETQRKYEEMINIKQKSDDRMKQRIIHDTQKRMDMYDLMYPPHLLENVFGLEARIEFLTSRTIRTMAQYMALGELIARVPRSVIINHPTTNIGFYNEKFGRERQTIPVFEMKRRVYK